MEEHKVSDGSGLSEVPTATRVAVKSLAAVVDLIAKGMAARTEVRSCRGLRVHACAVLCPVLCVPCVVM